jgi:hypothetical protein
MVMGWSHDPTVLFLAYEGILTKAKTHGTAKPVDYMSLKEVPEFLYELERLGLVKGTGEFQNGNPVFIPTVEVNGPMDTRPNTEGWLSK